MKHVELFKRLNEHSAEDAFVLMRYVAGLEATKAELLEQCELTKQMLRVACLVIRDDETRAAVLRQCDDAEAALTKANANSGGAV